MASTYRRILECVSKRVLDGGADLHMDEPIVKIEAGARSRKVPIINKSSAEPPPPPPPCRVTLTAAAGREYAVDEVVVTCPLGWLKRNKSAFVPEPPQHLVKAIDSISYGRLEKVYVTFPEAFWHTTTGSRAIWSAQFMNPTYVKNRPAKKEEEEDNNIFWNQECLSLASLPADSAHPTLLFYTTGPCSSHLVGRIANLPPSSDKYYDILNEFLHPFYSRLGGYCASSPACKPIAFLATQWQNDAYAGNGSYSNFLVGVEQADRDIETLRAAMGVDRGVWFAGEHTAPFVALGTTSGAYWSGERAAGQICDVYGLGRCGMGEGRDDSLPSAVGRRVVTTGES